VGVGMIDLRLGDCQEVLPTLADKSVHLVAIDPPYLTTNLHFDKQHLDMSWVNELLRIVKDDGYLAVFAPVEMSAYIATIWNLRFTGFWLKSLPGNRTHAAKKPRSKSELYTVFAHPNHKVSRLTWNDIKIEGTPYKKIYKKTGYKRGGHDQIDRASTCGWTEDGYVMENEGWRFQTDVINGNTKPCMPYVERTEHPTQKPENVMSTFIQWLTNEGDTVLDNFMGSGTTGVASVKLRRNFVGIEKHADYFEMAQRRIEAASAQGGLF